MKNKISIMFIVFILFITGCNNNNLDQEKIILDSLSLEEKIAQMLIIYHPSNEYDEIRAGIEDTIKSIYQYHIYLIV